MTTIEKLIHTIEQLESVANQALELAEEYSGGESETADQLRAMVQEIMDDHHADD